MTTLCVGLTGGIASGKTTVGDLFSNKGIDVFDADQVSRDLVAPGQPALKEIADTFGADVLTENGELNRPIMRELVFNAPDQRKCLEEILHPRIHTELSNRRESSQSAYCILMIPLLAKTGMRDLVTRILVVDVAESTQLARLIGRDNITAELANAMIAAQETRQQRLNIADDIIVNDGSPAELIAPVDALHAKYLQIC